MEQLPGIYDALSAAGPNYGLRDFGLYAMDSLRLDKGYRGWKTDIETGYLPYEASLDRFVSLEKPAFIGRDALIREAERGVAQRVVPLTSPVTMSVFDQGISGATMTSIAVSPSMAKMTATASVESD
jgi:dimethylglycine dehydrogenase